MFPTLKSQHSSQLSQSKIITKTPQKTPNPLELGGLESQHKSPPPSPKHQKQHVGQLVPSSPVELKEDSKKVPKRIQLVQLQIQSDKTDIKNDTKNLKAKVDLVFNAFEKMIDQNLVDNRKGSVPVYTLPEFFWSDFSSNLTEDQQKTLIHDIKERAKDPKFEGAVFVLGTMTTAYAPKSLASIHQPDLNLIQQKLGDLPNLENDQTLDFTKAFQEATGPEVEDCSTDRQEARALLSTVGDMLNARMDKANIPRDTPVENIDTKIFDRDKELADILDTVKFMAENREGLSILATARKGKMLGRDDMNKFIQLVNTNKFKQAKKLIAKKMSPAFTTNSFSDDRMQQIAKVFTKMGSNKTKVHNFAKDFRAFYFSKSATNSDRSRFNGKVDKFNKTKNVTKMPHLDSPSSMFKITENKAMVIEGGPKGKVGFVQKLLPSLADQPSYFKSRDENTLVPQKLQSKSILAHPNSEDQLKQKIEQHGIKRENFMFESPKTGVNLGIAICRDYSEGVYKDHFDQKIKNDIDHLQIVSAGVPRLKDHHGHFGTSVGLNDGLSGGSQFSTKTTYQDQNPKDLKTDVVTYNPKTDKFTLHPYSRGFEKQGLTLDDKSFGMGLGLPTHLKDAPNSSIRSFKSDTNGGTVKLMEKLIQDHETSISVYSERMNELGPILAKMKPTVDQISTINMTLTRDNEARQKFDKEKKDPMLTYQSDVDVQSLNEQLDQLHAKLKPWLDQINSDPLLLQENDLHELQTYGDRDGVAAFGDLSGKFSKMEESVRDSKSIIEYNQKSLDRIKVDRLRSQQNQYV